MPRRDLPGREPYPQFEPMAWTAECDVDLRSTPRSLVAMLAIGLLCLALAFCAP